MRGQVFPGFAAVSHRAVAARAGLPLAATTYYFTSREELVQEAVRRLARGYVETARARAEQVRPGDDLAAVIVDLVAGDADEARLLTM